jgi:hypothetical protein
MKNWILCIALSVCGCGGSSNGNNDTPAPSSAKGTWKGNFSTWSVTMVVDQVIESGSTAALMGTLSTNNSNCFNSGSLSFSLTNSSVAIASTGAGSASSTIIQIDGELSGGTITGYIETTALSDEGDQCTVARTPITLTRQ